VSDHADASVVDESVERAPALVRDVTHAGDHVADVVDLRLDVAIADTSPPYAVLVFGNSGAATTKPFVAMLPSSGPYAPETSA
jgi:hypothetical protein